MVAKEIKLGIKDLHSFSTKIDWYCCWASDWYGFDGWSATFKNKQLVCVLSFAMFLSYWLLSKYFFWIIIVNPCETLLLTESMTGQEAAKLIVYFDSAVGSTGDIFTKLDGNPRGWVADSVLGVSGKSIKFVVSGEMVKDL